MEKSKEDLQSELEAERAEKRELLGALKDWQLLIDESDGVAGYHLNGNIAYWDELLPSYLASHEKVISNTSTAPTEAEIRADEARKQILRDADWLSEKGATGYVDEYSLVDAANELRQRVDGGNDGT